MMVILVVAVGLLSLSSIATRSSAVGSAKEKARANARLALMMALGELQKHAGPDQRVTGPGSLAGDGALNPNWTGVWSTIHKETLPVWLVSGNELGSPADLDSFTSYPGSYVTPMDEPGQNAVVLHNDPDPLREVRVPTVPIRSGDDILGRYAWWISDEGTKARVNLASPGVAATTQGERIVRSRVAQENGIQHLDPLLQVLSPLAAEQDRIDKRRLISSKTIDLVNHGNGGNTLSDKYFHDLTTGGYGLPVDVVDGGMKTDLSIAFDSSQSTRGYVEDIMGAKPVLTGGGASNRYYEFKINKSSTITNPETFYLISDLLDKDNTPIGPNWGILYNYAQLWRGVSPDGSMDPSR